MIENYNIMSKQGRKDYIRDTAPTLHAAFRELDIAEAKAKEKLKKKYGLFWKWKVSKKMIEKEQRKIAVKMTMDRYDREFALQEREE